MLRYIPSQIDEVVNQIILQIAKLFVEPIVFLTNPITDKNKSKKGKKQVEIELPAVEQIKWLVAIFIRYFIQNSTELIVMPVTQSSDEKLKKLFFLNEIVAFDQGIEKDIPSHIALWLDKFFLHQKKYTPVLRVEENKSNFRFDLLVKDLTTPGKLPVDLSKFFITNKTDKMEVLKSINLLAEYLPELSYALAENKTVFEVEGQNFATIFFDILPKLKLLSIDVVLPKSLKNLAFPQLALVASKFATTTNNLSCMSLDQVLGFNWTVSIAGKNLSVAEFNKLFKEARGLVKFNDSYVYIDQRQMGKMIKAAGSEVKPSGMQMLKAVLLEEFEGNPILLSDDIHQLVQKLMETPDVEIPQLNATLRDYQYRGFCWLYKNAKIGVGSIIADDMGLGKTLQVITCIQKLKSDKIIMQALAVVPTSLLSNWQKEVAHFAPDLKISLFHARDRDTKSNCDIVLTTYGMLRTNQDYFLKKKWDLLVIDEAQNIKNIDTEQTKLVKKIDAKLRIAMSGTPVENRLLEYYSIFDFCNKGYLGSRKYFVDEFSNPIERERDVIKLNKFKAVTKPFVLRRLKSDKSIIKDLPDKISSDHYFELTPKQIALYKANLDECLEKISQSEGIERRGMVLKMIISLKQICNHPAQYLKNKDLSIADSGKMELLLDKARSIYANNEKLLIFTQFTQMGQIIETTLKQELNEKILFLHGGLSRVQRDDVVSKFQNDAYHKTMVLSIKAGGVGLNLVGANHVIHYDLWWNPAVESQATDRAYRIGQKKNVFVHRLIASNTFEEKINAMLKKKQELADLTVSAGEEWIGNLNDVELRNIFSYEI